MQVWVAPLVHVLFVVFSAGRLTFVFLGFVVVFILIFLFAIIVIRVGFGFFLFFVRLSKQWISFLIQLLGNLKKAVTDRSPIAAAFVILKVEVVKHAAINATECL